MSSYTYDAAGDVTYDGLNSYLYDAEGRVCAIRSYVDTVTGYIYDADGTRVAKGTLTSFSCNFASNGFTPATSWVLGPGGDQVTEYAVSGATSTWQHTNAFSGGKLQVTYHDTGIYFYLSDWLGTKRTELGQMLAANGTNQLCAAAFASLPYGDGLTPPLSLSGYATCPDATEHHFTGKERDAESGNDYFGARYYSSAMGRFLIPDWSAKVTPVPYAKLDDPQSLNLYAYVLNNPLSRVDVDGHSDYLWQKTKNWFEGNGFKTDAQVHGLSISQVALSHKGSMDWAINGTNTSGKDVGHPQVFKPGQDKCNEFTGDNAAEAGKTRPEIKDANGNTRMPDSHELADPNVHIPGWSDTKPLSEAQPNDIIAQAHGDVNGHSGDVVMVDGKLQTVSADAYKGGQIEVNDWGFRPAGQNGESATDPAPVVRHPE